MNQINLWKKSLLLGIILSFTVIFHLACVVDPEDAEGDNKYSASESFSYSLDTAELTGVNLAGVNGDIEIVGLTNTSKIEVWGERRVESKSQADADEHLDWLEVKISKKNQTAYIETEQPNENKGRNYVVEYHLRIPRTLLLTVENINGEVNIDSMKNTVRVELVNGKVDLDEIAASAQVAVVNGEIDAQLVLPAGGKHTLTTTNGAIKYKIPASTSAEFSASVVNGSVHIEQLQLINSTYTAKSVTGKLGNGDGKISLAAVNGNINAFGY